MRRFYSLILAFLLAACSTASPMVPTTTLLPTSQPGSGQAAAPTATRAAPQSQPSPTVQDQTPTPAPTATPPATATPLPPPPGGDLGGTVWQWQALEPASGSAQAIPDPEHYAVAFLPDGKLNLQAGCAASGGSYQANGSSLTLQPDAPQAACPAGSQADAFLKNLSAANAFIFSNGYLVLALQGGGVMKLIPAAIVNPSAPQAGGAAALAKTFASVRSGPGLSYPIYGVLPAGANAALGGRHFDSGWWALQMPGYPDQLGWVPPDAVQVSNEGSVPYLQVIFLQIGEKLLWPDLSDPRASMTSPANIYAGPGQPYPVVLVGLPGDTLYVIGRSPDSQYLVVYLGPNRVAGGTGWVASKDVETRNTAGVPVFQAPPLTAAALANGPTAIAVGVMAVNLREGPDVAYPVVDVAERGQSLEITGQTRDHLWWQIRVPLSISPTGKAYVAQSVIRAVNAENVAILPDAFPPLYGQFEKIGPDCAVFSRTPLELQLFSRGEDFSADFEILNNTQKTWSRGDLDFVFLADIDNAPLHLGANRLDFNETVSPGRTIHLQFKAEAPPKHGGVFGEYWVIREAGKTVCSFSYLIRVRP